MREENFEKAIGLVQMGYLVKSKATDRTIKFAQGKYYYKYPFHFENEWLEFDEGIRGIEPEEVINNWEII